MVASRYVSDKLYMGQEEKIFPSFVTAVSLGVIIAGTAAALFLFFVADLPVLYELLCYFLCISITVSFVTMTYVSAVKDYRKISMSFLIGCGLGIITEIILRNFFGVNVIYSIMIGFNVAFLIIGIMLILSVYSFFRVHDESFFALFKYIKKMPSLIVINTFYYVGIFIHSIIIWQSDLGVNIANTFIVAPIYDVPSFYALLTAMPIMVIFVIKTETTFYGYYKEYMKMLVGGGTLKDLRYAGDTMQENMYNEIIAMLQIQLMISALCIVLSRILLPLIGFSDFEIGIFGYMTLGYYCIMGVHVISSIILYFDDRISAMQIMLFFLITHIVCVIISVQYGQDFIGLGTTVAGVLSIIFAFVKLRLMVRSLDYRLYCSQPIFVNQE